MDASGQSNVEGSPQTARFDETFVARQKARLDELRTTLLRELDDVNEDEREWREEGQEARHDLGDLGSNLLARELDVALEKQLGQRLELVERALEKIEEGTYGLCDATGEPIPKGRLEAIPEAVYTLEAQRRREGMP
jgi:DnaK suppressor protein